MLNHEQSKSWVLIFFYKFKNHSLKGQVTFHPKKWPQKGHRYNHSTPHFFHHMQLLYKR